MMHAYVRTSSLIVLQSEVRKMYNDLLEDEPDFDGFKFDSRYV